MKKRKLDFLFLFLLAGGFFVFGLMEGNVSLAAGETEPVAVTEPASEVPAEPAEAAEEEAAEPAETETPAEADSTEATDFTEATDSTKVTAAENDSDSETPVKTDSEPKSGSEASAEKEPLSIYDLFVSGGVLMIPIAFMSFLVITVGLERLFALRRGAVLPRKLIHNVDVQVSAKADPRAIYALCRKSRSAASNVIEAALFKAGRPMSEVQDALQNAKENEANRLYGRVRLLVLAAAVTPLIGLLGTVLGMIEAFMATASSVGVHKAEMLSQGIYLALITTCAGLIVAIPAAILAHWYEGKIQKLFYRMDLQLVNFISYLEGLEGKVHLTPAHFRAYVKQKTGK